MADRPVDDQPPLLVKFSNASCAVARGARHQSGTMTPKTPQMWMITAVPSVSGNLLASSVLKMMLKQMTAMVSKVPW